MTNDAHHAAGGATSVAPYGSWVSSLGVDFVAGSPVALSEPWIDSDSVYWLEGRADEGGRRTLLCHGTDGVTRELTPDPFRAGNRVHEYGGGSYTVDRGRVVVSSMTDGRLWLIDPAAAGQDSRPITPEGPWRYADLRFDPRAARLYAVRETHDAAEPDRADLVVNELVAIALDGRDGPGRVLVSGPDFVAAPRPSPDGGQLAWLEWDFPDMPWDATQLKVAQLGLDGRVAPARLVAGGPGVSIVQPEWSPGGVLHYVSDATGWWNLYGFLGPDGLDGPARNLAPMDAELAGPAWVFGLSWYAFAPETPAEQERAVAAEPDDEPLVPVLAVARSSGRDTLWRVFRGATPVELPYTEIASIRVVGSLALVIAGGPHDPSALVRLDAYTGQPAGVLARSISSSLDAGQLPHPEAIEFPTGDGARARALYFAPTNATFRGPDDERPPLLVLSHGGPTSCASSALSFDRTFFTSRGIAVVDVDYRGSTGYGRPYRDALKGRWGIVDVEDCIAAAHFLADRGSVDPARMAIRGGSAGGYTTLAALTFRPEAFAAGISRYGIADLELIHLDGHKFEVRYDEGMIAPWPEGRSVFRERSPIHALDRIRVPMLILQGLDDKVVPPSQVDAMEAALHGHNVPHAVLLFEGEGHGFRRADTKRAAFAAELSFLGQVFAFTPADELPPLQIPGLRVA
jgi:dipeptidyl aminopeptidase/acylaminoacyl peptidase